MIKILSLLLVCFISTNAQDLGETLLKNLQDKFEKIDNLSAEFKQTTNGRAQLTGKFFFKKDDKLRIELKNSILVSDGFTNWSYNQKENKVIISNNTESNASAFSLRKIVLEYPKECDISSEKENENSVLVLTPNPNSSIEYDLIKIWLTKENLINQIVLKDKADNFIQIRFTKYKLNQNILDAKFKFTPSEGSKVIDLR